MAVCGRGADGGFWFWLLGARDPAMPCCAMLAAHTENGSWIPELPSPHTAGWNPQVEEAGGDLSVVTALAQSPAVGISSSGQWWSPIHCSSAGLSGRLPKPAPGMEGWRRAMEACDGGVRWRCAMSCLVVSWWRRVQNQRTSSHQPGGSFTVRFLPKPWGGLTSPRWAPWKGDFLMLHGSGRVWTRCAPLVGVRWDAGGCSFLNLKPKQQGSARACPSDPSRSWCVRQTQAGAGVFCGRAGPQMMVTSRMRADCLWLRRWLWREALADGCSSAEAACCAVRPVFLGRGWFPAWLLCH